jgi:crossover junction endodeoxyribonuclease RuvC
MKIACFDLGSMTGYAFMSDKHIISGVWNFRPQRFEGGGMRFLRFRQKLNEAHGAAKFTEVYFEEVRRHLGTDAAHVYGGLLGQLTAWCEENNIPYAGIPVQTIKKSWTGKGNAKKALMIAEANARGFATEDENEADALAIAHHIKQQKGIA